jgi:uncharacterized protein
LKRIQLLCDLAANSAFDVSVTNTRFERMKGLLGKVGLKADEGMLISKCNMVHTFGMKFPIDVVFLNESLDVLKIAHNVRPNRIAVCFGAKCVLELKSGQCARNNLAVGAKFVESHN